MSHPVAHVIDGEHVHPRCLPDTLARQRRLARDWAEGREVDPTTDEEEWLLLVEHANAYTVFPDGEADDIVTTFTAPCTECWAPIRKARA